MLIHLFKQGHLVCKRVDARTAKLFTDALIGNEYKNKTCSDTQDDDLPNICDLGCGKRIRP